MRYLITITYGRRVWYTRELHAESLNAATIIASLSYPRASTITVEARG